MKIISVQENVAHEKEVDYTAGEKCVFRNLYGKFFSHANL